MASISNVVKEWIKKNDTGKKKWETVAIAGLAGILLLIISYPIKKIDQKKTDTKVKEQTVVTGTDHSAREYENMLEKRLSDVLVSMEGVGQVKVMVTLESSGEVIVDKNDKLEKQEVESTGKDGTVSKESNTKNEPESVMIENDEGTSPFVTKELEPKVSGVVVLAQGANDPVIVNEITEAVEALFSIDAHKVKVLKMK